jgi:hypothetical protein
MLKNKGRCKAKISRFTNEDIEHWTYAKEFAETKIKSRNITTRSQVYVSEEHITKNVQGQGILVSQARNKLLQTANIAHLLGYIASCLIRLYIVTAVRPHDPNSGIFIHI